MGQTSANILDKPFSMEMANSLDELDRPRRFCRDVVAAVWPNEDHNDIADRVQLAIVEAISNVIRHGSVKNSDDPIQLQAFEENQDLVFEISHKGKTYSPGKTSPVLEPREGGMGQFLIEQCVDSVQYRSVAGLQRVIMRVKKS